MRFPRRQVRYTYTETYTCNLCRIDKSKKTTERRRKEEKKVRIEEVYCSAAFASTISFPSTTT